MAAWQQKEAKHHWHNKEKGKEPQDSTWFSLLTFYLEDRCYGSILYSKEIRKWQWLRGFSMLKKSCPMLIQIPCHLFINYSPFFRIWNSSICSTPIHKLQNHSSSSLHMSRLLELFMFAHKASTWGIHSNPDIVSSWNVLETNEYLSQSLLQSKTHQLRFSRSQLFRKRISCVKTQPIQH